MPFNLAQFAQVQKKPLPKAIIMNMIREIPFLQILPFEGVDTLSINVVRYEKLPTGYAFRRINEGYTESTDGQLGEVTEHIYLYGGEIKMDKIFTKAKGFIRDPLTTQTEMKVVSGAIDFKNHFINGDSAVTPDGFEGLKKRVAALPSRQTVTADGTGSTTACDVTASATAARKWLNRFEKCYRRCAQGKVSAMFCNEDMLLGFGAACRLLQTAGAFLDTTKDVLGREFVTWKGTPFYDLGTLQDQSTEIITNTELADDGGSDSTSIYFAAFNMLDGIVGIQMNPPEVYDPLSGGEMEGQPQILRRIDWPVGLAGFGSYGLVRMHNILAPTSWTE